MTLNASQYHNNFLSFQIPQIKDSIVPKASTSTPVTSGRFLATYALVQLSYKLGFP